MKCEVNYPQIAPPPPEYVLTLSEDEAQLLKRIMGFLEGTRAIGALRISFNGFDFGDATEMSKLASQLVSALPVKATWPKRVTDFYNAGAIWPKF